MKSTVHELMGKEKPFERPPLEITVVTYKCQECGAVDHDKLFEHENPVQPINCSSCHAKNSMYVVPEETTKYRK